MTQQERLATEQVTRSMKEVTGLLSRALTNTTQAERSARDLAGRADELSLLTAGFKGAARAE